MCICQSCPSYLTNSPDLHMSVLSVLSHKLPRCAYASLFCLISQTPQLCICQSCLSYLTNSPDVLMPVLSVLSQKLPPNLSSCYSLLLYLHTTKFIAATWNHLPVFPYGKSAGIEQCHQSHGHEISWRDPPGGRTSRTGPHSLQSAKQCQLLYCLDQNMHLLSQKKGPLCKICLCLLIPDCANITFIVTEIALYARAMMVVIT